MDEVSSGASANVDIFVNDEKLTEETLLSCNVPIVHNKQSLLHEYIQAHLLKIRFNIEQQAWSHIQILN